jgi:predicted ATP-dependent Lon-type protease
MGMFENNSDEMEMSLDALLNKHFAGKVVRKDLTKLIRGSKRSCLCFGVSTGNVLCQR